VKPPREALRKKKHLDTDKADECMIKAVKFQNKELLSDSYPI
jgi:hypothetical protein